jgi:protein TonB
MDFPLVEEPPILHSEDDLLVEFEAHEVVVKADDSALAPEPSIVFFNRYPAPPPENTQPEDQTVARRPQPERRDDPAVALRLVPGSNHPPHYPRLARRRGYEGRVILRLDVGHDGTVARVVVLKSSGHAVLDRAAATAARAWRFMTTMRGRGASDAGVVSVRVPIVFKLE